MRQLQKKAKYLEKEFGIKMRKESKSRSRSASKKRTQDSFKEGGNDVVTFNNSTAISPYDSVGAQVVNKNMFRTDTETFSETQAKALAQLNSSRMGTITEIMPSAGESHTDINNIIVGQGQCINWPLPSSSFASNVGSLNRSGSIENIK